MDQQDKAIIIFYRQRTDFKKWFHSLLVESVQGKVAVEYFYQERQRHIELLNFLVTPSPLFHEVTIQSINSVIKRGVIKPSPLEYIFIKLDRRVPRSAVTKNKTIKCKEKNINFIKLGSPVPHVLKKRFQKIEIFYQPAQHLEIFAPLQEII